MNRDASSFRDCYFRSVICFIDDFHLPTESKLASPFTPTASKTFALYAEISVTFQISFMLI